ncbi:4'-phosphopantetheinyl transferase family protein [Pseudoclavibacter helvolus]|uniref:4'-phosphopantetheinyl transferase family protein n=1 Tax=Pseudoclavibacter helvolus TaxID=255205 RepID=UPI003C74976F
MIAVLAAGVDEVLDVASLCASAEDRAAAEARSTAELRRRTLAGRAALRLLAAWGRGEPLEQASEFEISRRCPDCGRAHGRPTSVDLALSSSTSSGRVLAAIADPADAIGVDIEAVPRQLWREFDSYALHPDERDDLIAVGDPGGVAARIGVWTAKEAALKVSGRGLRTEPSLLRIDARPDLSHPEPAHPDATQPAAARPAATDASWHRVHGAPAPAGPRGAVSVRMLAVGSNARAAVATNRPQEVRLWTMPQLLAELGCLPDWTTDTGEIAHLI